MLLSVSSHNCCVMHWDHQLYFSFDLVFASILRSVQWNAAAVFENTLFYLKNLYVFKITFLKWMLNYPHSESCRVFFWAFVVKPLKDFYSPFLSGCPRDFFFLFFFQALRLFFINYPGIFIIFIVLISPLILTISDLFFFSGFFNIW